LGEESGPAVLVGWSLGGLLALRAAANSPERAAGLVLVAATARMTAEGDYPGVPAKVLRGMILKLRRDREAVLREFAANALHPQRDSGWEGEFLAMAATFETQDLLRGLEFLAAADLRDCLREIRLPVRILHGSGDRIIPLEQAVFLHQRLAGSTLKRVEGAGHHLLSTQADQIVAEIEALADDRRAD
ncbi:MAG: alpha/beta fold hydrolase, partial [Deltaproteobacteria bacterium]|nr:alpha/beta fold hydrolase [Deltaproteobacteria bacterium]